MNKKPETDLQYALEQKWREILLKDPTEENYAAAYAELHNFKLEHGDPRTGKEASGLYRGSVSFAGKAIARLVGTGRDVLEIGCGDGSLAFLLAENGNRVVATDVSDIALAVCNEEKDRRGVSQVTFAHGEATKVDCPDEAFDYVISQDLVEHLPEDMMPAHLAEVRRVVRSRGSYVFWTPSKLYGHTSMGMHLKEYNLKEAMRAVEAAGFKAVWVDARWYKLGLILQVPSLANPFACVGESVLGTLQIDRLPMAARQMLAPPILLRAIKR